MTSGIALEMTPHKWTAHRVYATLKMEPNAKGSYLVVTLSVAGSEPIVLGDLRRRFAPDIYEVGRFLDWDKTARAVIASGWALTFSFRRAPDGRFEIGEERLSRDGFWEFLLAQIQASTDPRSLARRIRKEALRPFDVDYFAKEEARLGMVADPAGAENQNISEKMRIFLARRSAKIQLDRSAPMEGGAE